MVVDLIRSRVMLEAEIWTLRQQINVLPPVLEAMGLTSEVGMGAIRFSLGRGTTREEIDAVTERLGDLPGTAFMAMSSGKPA
jgi:hypothetical protein